MKEFTLRELLDEIKFFHQIVEGITTRINDMDTRSCTSRVSQEEYGLDEMYYSDLDLLQYFVNQIGYYEHKIETGNYREENNYRI